jgi:hypothetical protein
MVSFSRVVGSWWGWVIEAEIERDKYRPLGLQSSSYLGWCC